jgi:large subunit ribosomal protein L21
MFAVIKTGGKQYKVAEGDEIIIEKLDAEAGNDVTFEEVLLLGKDGKVEVGAPTVAGASVVGKVAEQRKGAKVMIFKKRQRNTYRRKKGHRQLETVVTIESILAKGQKPAAKKAAPKTTAAKTAAPEAASEAKTAAKAAPKKAPAKPAEAKAEPKKAETLTGADDRGRLAAAQGTADDLKKITGIGPAFEKKLNAAGIFHYWQIGGLKKAQIADLEAELNMSGRVERDDWVKQAKALAKGA